MTARAHLTDLTFAVLIGGLIVFMALSDGAIAPAKLVQVFVVLWVAAVGHVLFAKRPFPGQKAGLWVVTALLAALTAWVYLSRTWSGADIRSAIETARWLLNIGGLLFGAFVLAGLSRQRQTIRFMTIGFAVVMTASLLSRVAPSLITITDAAADERLAWPVTYWNALGTLAGLALLVGLWSSIHGPTVADRLLGAATVPLSTSVLLLTFSRGALAATIVAVVILVLAAGIRRSVSSVLAVIAPTAWCALTVLGADALTSPGWQQADAEANALIVAVVVGAIAAAVLRLAFGRADARVEAIPRAPRGVTIAVLAGAAVVAVAGFAAAGGPSWLDDRVQEFEATNNTAAEKGERFTTIQNNGRIKMWRAALDMYEAEPIHGTGAGTYAVEWNQYRGIAPYRSEAHSLYLEALGELGVIGLALLAAALVALAVALVRATSRTPVAALALAALALAAVAAAVDWTWKLTAITLPLMLLCGMALGPIGRADDAAGVADDDAPTDSTDQGDDAASAQVAAAEPANASDASRPADAEERPTRELARLGVFIAMLVLAVPVVRVGLSEARLLEAREQVIKQANCTAGLGTARSVDSVLDRPEPKLLIAFCETTRQNVPAAITALRDGEAGDPRNWIYPYTLGLLLPRVGQDPRPALRRAQALDPSSTLPSEALELFDDTPKSRWAEAANDVGLPLQFF